MRLFLDLLAWDCMEIPNRPYALEEEHKSLKIARNVAKTSPQHAICKL